jgi:hypothetical protein
MAPAPLQVASAMNATQLKTSARLQRAAEAQRAELHERRARLAAEREATLARLREIESALAELDERERLLDQLAPRPAGGEVDVDVDVDGVGAVGSAVAGALAAGAVGVDVQIDGGTGGAVGAGASGTAAGNDIVLRGPAIRETAVRVLVERGGIEALHYRDWYELLTGRGYSVAGKDGLAVFLTQISRSPAVRKGTQAGVYELDREAPRRLAGELSRLQSELRELIGRTPGTTDLSEIRARREQLTSAIGHIERALEEAQRVLALGEHGGAEVSLPVVAAS